MKRHPKIGLKIPESNNKKENQMHARHRMSLVFFFLLLLL